MAKLAKVKGNKRDKIHSAVLEPVALRILYVQINAAVDGDRMQRRCIEEAHRELTEILGARPKLGGSVSFKNWGKIEKQGKDQYEFTHAAVVGVKLAIVQAITGVPNQRPKAELWSRNELLAVAACFSSKFLAAVKRDAKLDEDEFDDVDIELEDLSEEPEETKKNETSAKSGDGVESQAKKEEAS